ncbi:MAG: formyl transferase [Rhodospirillaceae bacterium]|nr:formyl transferase [Rhodospirillaceae bacterium]
MPLRKDIWRVGIVRAPLQRLLALGTLDTQDITWLPEMPSLRFIADPFGVWRDGRLYVFAEIYDYRDRIGKIEVLTFGPDLQLLDRRIALQEPWHLSYPFIVETDGEIYMLPEAFRSDRLTLYRAAEFPHRWIPVKSIELDQVPIDATPMYHDGLWWLFYVPATTKLAKFSALHAAFAPHLTGPWTPHPRNPVRLDSASARPGGTPIVVDGTIILPVQDCSATYGGAIRALHITHLSPDSFDAMAGNAIRAPHSAGAYTHGLHTMSAAGHLTLIDAKCFHLSAHSLVLDVGQVFGKFRQRRGP